MSVRLYRSACGNCLTIVLLADTAAVWAAVLVFDAIVFGLTAYRVLQVGRKWRGSLFTLMLRDGEHFSRPLIDPCRY